MCIKKRVKLGALLKTVVVKCVMREPTLPVMATLRATNAQKGRQVLLVPAKKEIANGVCKLAYIIP